MKGRRSNAQYFSKKSPFGRKNFQAHNLNQENINLPDASDYPDLTQESINLPDPWYYTEYYPDYFELERTRLEDNQGELQPFQMGEDVRLGPEKQSESVLIENIESIEKDENNIKHFHTFKWKEWEQSATSSISISSLTPKLLDGDSIKALIVAIIGYQLKKTGSPIGDPDPRGFVSN